MNVSFLSLRSESTVAQRLEIGLTDFTWHSHALCFPPFSFSIFFKTVPLCTGYHIVKKFSWGGSLLIFSHSTQACICLPGRCLSPKEQMFSLQSCLIFTMSQFLPDSMVSWLVCPNFALCLFLFSCASLGLLVKS